MRTAIAVVLAVAVLALGGWVVNGWLTLREMQAAPAAGAEAMATARSVAPDLLSYDYRTIEQDLARARQHTTGELAKHYQELASTLVTKARAEKTVQTAAVAGAAVMDEKPDRVEVLLFVNLGTVKQVPGKAEPQQQVSQNRAKLVMVRQGSRWLAEGLSTLLGTA